MSEQSDAPVIVLVACEQSGDNYGALLAEELKRKHPGVRLMGLGGPRMEAAGVELLVNMIEHSATGIVEILGSLRFFINAMRDVVALAQRENAQAAVLIDSPDFNLRIAPKLKSAGVPVAYYVSPQMWAWRSGRVEKIRRYVDRMLVILPFEQAWYEERNAQASFVGHPMLDLFDVDAKREAGKALRAKLLESQSDSTKLVGLLPGSRRNEITKLLPRFLETARYLKSQRNDLRFALGCSRWLNDERARAMLEDYADLNVEILHDQSHELMAASDAVLCCSGTATLECALIGTPLVMAYRLSWLTWLIAMFILDANGLFCLPNIIMGKRVIPEMIQFQTRPETLALTLDEVLGERGVEMRAELARIPDLLGGTGASARCADEVLEIAGLKA